MSENGEVNYNDFMLPDEEVEASHGLVNEPMPKGKYLLTIAKIEAMDTTKGGVPRARLRLRSKDVATGEFYGPPAFVEIYLGAGKAKYENGQLAGEKSAEEYQKSLKGALGRVRGFMESIGVGKGSPGQGLDGVFQFYNVPSWEGREFVGTVTVDNQDRNNLMNFHSVNDAKHGVSSVKAKGAVGAVTAPTASVL